MLILKKFLLIQEFYFPGTWSRPCAAVLTCCDCCYKRELQASTYYCSVRMTFPDPDLPTTTVITDCYATVATNEGEQMIVGLSTTDIGRRWDYYPVSALYCRWNNNVVLVHWLMWERLGLLSLQTWEV